MKEKERFTFRLLHIYLSERFLIVIVNEPDVSRAHWDQAELIYHVLLFRSAILGIDSKKTIFCQIFSQNESRLYLQSILIFCENASLFLPSFDLVACDLKNQPVHWKVTMTNVAARSHYQLFVSKLFSRNYYARISLNGNVLTTRLFPTLDPGQYRIRFSALKHFGDATNHDDFDIYCSPPFNLLL